MSIWKPQVTSLSDLKPQELNQMNYGDDGQPYVQKTSLAYTQPVSVNPSSWGMGVHTTRECEPIFLGGLTHNPSV